MTKAWISTRHFPLRIYGHSLKLLNVLGGGTRYILKLQLGNRVGIFNLVSNPSNYGNLFIFSLCFISISSFLPFFILFLIRILFFFPSLFLACFIPRPSRLPIPSLPPPLLSAEFSPAGLPPDYGGSWLLGYNLLSDWLFLEPVFIVETWFLPQWVKRGVNIFCLPDERFPHVVWRTLHIFRTRQGREEVFGGGQGESAGWFSQFVRALVPGNPRPLLLSRQRQVTCKKGKILVLGDQWHP